MKLGKEVEGRLRGVPTLFVDAYEVLNALANVKHTIWQYSVQHVYISDHSNILDYNAVGAEFADKLITMDVTNIKAEPRPQNVTFILTMPHDFWASVQRLAPDDQIKFHSEHRDVLCASVRSFVPTQPIEFIGDQELQ